MKIYASTPSNHLRGMARMLRRVTAKMKEELQFANGKQTLRHADSQPGSWKDLTKKNKCPVTATHQNNSSLCVCVCI